MCSLVRVHTIITISLVCLSIYLSIYLYNCCSGEKRGKVCRIIDATNYNYDFLPSPLLNLTSRMMIQSLLWTREILHHQFNRK